MKYISKNNIKIPTRNPKSHKGQNGTVLAVGGSEEFVGAITLAGLAAARSGADLVKVIAPEKIAWAINCYTPELITQKVKGSHLKLKDFKTVKTALKKFEILLIGNGISQNKETQKFCKKIIKQTKNPKVIDADAIKAISINDCENSILTPHNRELEHLLINSINSNTINKKNKLNKQTIKKIINEKNIEKKSKLIQTVLNKKLKNNVIILKGKIDSIIAKNKIYFNKTGNAGMTRGGTGDVLAGLAAGFLSQNKDLTQSAINAAYFNGLIGDNLKKKKGYTYLATDMVDEIKKSKKAIKNLI